MHESEAACLLRTGAMYSRRVGLRRDDGKIVFAGVKRGAFSLYFDDEPIYHFDLDGRWQRAYITGDHFRKALNQSVDLIGRERDPEGLILRRRARSREEIDALDDAIRGVALTTLERLGKGAFELLPPPANSELLATDELADLLERVVAWDAAAWFARAEDFAKVYGTEALRGQGPFIPPDSQNAIVVNARCGSTAGDFEAHCHDVERFLGRRAIQSSSVFLAGADALRRRGPEILAELRTVASVFPIREGARPLRPRDLPHDRPSLSGIDAMYEARRDGPPLVDRDSWDDLASAHLRRVTVTFGLRDPVADPVADVSAIKAADIAVSVVLPYGTRRLQRAEALAELVNAMPLSAGDFVHLIDCSEPIPGWEANSDGAVSDGLVGTGERLEFIERQREALLALLAPTRSRGAKVVKYDPVKQWT